MKYFIFFIYLCFLQAYTAISYGQKSIIEEAKELTAVAYRTYANRVEPKCLDTLLSQCVVSIRRTIDNENQLYDSVFKKKFKLWDKNLAMLNAKRIQFRCNEYGIAAIGRDKFQVIDSNFKRCSLSYKDITTHYIRHIYNKYIKFNISNDSIYPVSLLTGKNMAILILNNKTALRRIRKCDNDIIYMGEFFDYANYKQKIIFEPDIDSIMKYIDSAIMLNCDNIFIYFSGYARIFNQNYYTSSNMFDYEKSDLPKKITINFTDILKRLKNLKVDNNDDHSNVILAMDMYVALDDDLPDEDHDIICDEALWANNGDYAICLNYHRFGYMNYAGSTNSFFVDNFLSYVRDWQEKKKPISCQKAFRYCELMQDRANSEDNRDSRKPTFAPYYCIRLGSGKSVRFVLPKVLPPPPPPQPPIRNCEDTTINRTETDRIFNITFNKHFLDNINDILPKIFNDSSVIDKINRNAIYHEAHLTYYSEKTIRFKTDSCFTIDARNEYAIMFSSNDSMYKYHNDYDRKLNDWVAAEIEMKSNNLDSARICYLKANRCSYLPITLPFLGDLYAKKRNYNMAAKCYCDALDYGLQNITVYQMSFLRYYLKELGTDKGDILSRKFDFIDGLLPKELK